MPQWRCSFVWNFPLLWKEWTKKIKWFFFVRISSYFALYPYTNWIVWLLEKLVHISISHSRRLLPALQHISHTCEYFYHTRPHQLRLLWYSLNTNCIYARMIVAYNPILYLDAKCDNIVSPMAWIDKHT